MEGLDTAIDTINKICYPSCQLDWEALMLYGQLIRFFAKLNIIDSGCCSGFCQVIA